MGVEHMTDALGEMHKQAAAETVPSSTPTTPSQDRPTTQSPVTQEAEMMILPMAQTRESWLALPYAGLQMQALVSLKTDLIKWSMNPPATPEDKALRAAKEDKYYELSGFERLIIEKEDEPTIFREIPISPKEKYVFSKAEEAIGSEGPMRDIAFEQLMRHMDLGVDREVVRSQLEAEAQRVKYGKPMEAYRGYLGNYKNQRWDQFRVEQAAMRALGFDPVVIHPGEAIALKLSPQEPSGMSPILAPHDPDDTGRFRGWLNEKLQSAAPGEPARNTFDLKDYLARGIITEEDLSKMDRSSTTELPYMGPSQKVGFSADDPKDDSDYEAKDRQLAEFRENAITASAPDKDQAA